MADSTPKTRTALILLLALFVAGGAAALYVVNTSGGRPTGSLDQPTPDESERLAAAAEAVLGGATKAEVIGERAVITEAARLLDTDFGPILITQSRAQDDCHACAGLTGVAYLGESEDGGFIVERRWADLVEGWGNGEPSELAFDDRFTTNPAFLAKGSYTGQGVTASGFRIVELTPTGPMVSDLVRTGLDSSGLFGPDDPDRINLVGEAKEIDKDRGFIIRVKGSEQFDELYTIDGGRFVAVEKKSRLEL